MNVSVEQVEALGRRIVNASPLAERSTRIGAGGISDGVDIREPDRSGEVECGRMGRAGRRGPTASRGSQGGADGRRAGADWILTAGGACVAVSRRDRAGILFTRGGSQGRDGRAHGIRFGGMKRSEPQR
jgi:hypothetical protein